MKRVTSVLLVFVMLFGMLALVPVPAFAEEPTTEQITEPVTEAETEPAGEPETEPETEPEITPDLEQGTDSEEEHAFPQAGPCDCEYVPVVHLAGGHGPLVENEGTPEAVSYYGMNIDNLVRDVLPGLEPFIKASLLFRLDDVVTTALDMLWNWVGPLQMRPDGTSVKNLTRIDNTENDLKDKNHQDAWWWYWNRVYTISFDWRESPLKTADTLHAYIQRVREATGHSKVHLQAVSGSGTVLAAYVDKYVNQVDDPDVLSVVQGQSTAGGLASVGELFRKKININPQALSSFTWILALETSGTYEQYVLPVLNALYLTGVWDILAVWFPYWPEKYVDRIYEEFALPTYGTWPGFWAWVPNEDYEEAKKVMFEGHPEYYSEGFVDTIDAYYNQVAVRQDEIFIKANEKIKVAIMAGYDVAMLPFGNSSDADSDGLVKVERASLGGTAALFDRELPWSYQQAFDTEHNHLSPDRKIDASTCALPENTWFMKGALHQGWYEYGEWYHWWRDAPKGEDTVFSHPEYPQFVVTTSLSDQGDLFDPVQPEPMTVEKVMSWTWDRVLGTFRVILNWGGREIFKFCHEPLALGLWRFFKTEYDLLV